jgi:pimeloyl-ACP methyl ester carboxylesterase
MTVARTPVVFIHGLWLHASAWGPWVDLFRAAGYDAVAPGWPGIADTVAGARADPDAVARLSRQEVMRHYAAVAAAQARRPVVIGHSFGGTIAARLLADGRAAAAIAIDAAQIGGVLPPPLPTVRATLPVFRNRANAHHAVSLTADEFRASFGRALSAAESDELYQRWSIPAPGRALFEPTSFTPGQAGYPLLLIMSGRETAPGILGFPDRGHSLTVDHGWRDVAVACLDWLAEQSLRASVS